MPALVAGIHVLLATPQQARHGCLDKPGHDEMGAAVQVGWVCNVGGDVAADTMNRIWQTKYGPRRVRNDPPTLAEAIAAARGLTDDVKQQVEIAASLMDLSPDEVRPEVLKAAAATRKDVSEVAYVGRSGAPRTVVVERKPSRRVAGRKTIDR
jgi:hypothetical protein